MKKILIIIAVLTLFFIAGRFVKKEYDKAMEQYDTAQQTKELINYGQLHDGDLIFQTSASAQSKAIQLATKSKYSHCGLIFKEGGEYYVFEAVQPVKKTALEKWIGRGENGKYVIKRLRNADRILNAEALSKMKKAGESFAGKNYDLTFEWSDEEIYCSELIWKIYQRSTGIEIGKPEKLRDFDLSNGIVKAKMKERYGSKMPMNETVISPAAIFASEKLFVVAAN